MSFVLALPCNLDSAGAARRAVDELDGHLAADQLADVRLMVSELVTNSLRHAELRAEDSVELRVTLNPAILRVEVVDSGQTFELDGHAEDPETVEGWGLYLVATLADRWGLENEARENRVWFELDRAS